jgi:hypothetical protein
MALPLRRRLIRVPTDNDVQFVRKLLELPDHGPKKDMGRTRPPVKVDLNQPDKKPGVCAGKVSIFPAP